MKNRLSTLIIRTTLIIVVVSVVTGYTYSKSQDYINGPQVSVLTPTDGQTVTEQLLFISGTTKNISDISLNGNKIFINEDSEFSQSVLLSPGYNIITVWAQDRFEKTTETHLRIVYDDSLSDTPKIDTVIN